MAAAEHEVWFFRLSPAGAGPAHVQLVYRRRARQCSGLAAFRPDAGLLGESSTPEHRAPDSCQGADTAPSDVGHDPRLVVLTAASGLAGGGPLFCVRLPVREAGSRRPRVRPYLAAD